MGWNFLPFFYLFSSFHQSTQFNVYGWCIVISVKCITKQSLVLFVMDKITDGKRAFKPAMDLF